MKHIITTLSLLILSPFIIGQQYVNEFKQVNPDESFDNIHVKKLSTDINATTFAIWVKQKVKLHKHINHVENIYVSEGNGNFHLGDTTYKIEAGDLIIVPKDTWHGVDVTSKSPLKVVSIQSPEFIGKDRVFKDN